MTMRLSYPWGRIATATVVGVLFAVPPAPAQAPPAEFNFPTVPAEHKHARELLANALRYADPAHKLSDPVSGYPYEGWNQEPERKLFLRSFTQLTAIGLWMEVLANVAAGQADTPFLSRDQALARLALVAKTLRQDQADPQLSAKGLLGNFLDLATGRRRGPLTADADKKQFVAEFGQEKGEAVWKALTDKGWLAPRGKGDEAAVQRGADYGVDCFAGPLKPYCDAETKQKVMALLDRRTVLVVFGDNANLTASAARTIGALLLPEIKDRPEAAAVRRDLEQFLDAQKEGYAFLYDAKAGLFYFGWDGQRDRLFGWEDKEGKWVTGHMDYLVNEFRGPATFVCLRHGLPLTAVKNLGFKMKPYPMADGRIVHTFAPWEGSAFQVLGLQVGMNELSSPGWRAVLRTAVDVEIDYASRHKLPGFLSESYTGNGVEYTGSVGIPDITVSTKPRVTDTASLYSLGPAYTIAPDETEKFLAANWPVVSKLLTDHGPWEAYNTTRQEPVRFQTTAHTLSLALGLLGNSSDHMTRYLESRSLRDKLADVYRSGPAADLMAKDTQVFAWAPKKEPLKSGRDGDGFRVTAGKVGEVGIAVVPNKAGVNLSGGTLTVRYRAAGPATSAVIALKSAAQLPPGHIATEIFTRLADTGDHEAEIPLSLPATPGLTEVKEVVFTLRSETERAVNLTLAGLTFTPAADPTRSDATPADWPGWRGPALDGKSRDRSAPTKWSRTENVAWKVPVPGRGHSSPALWGDRLFLTTADESAQTQRVLAFDRKTGKALWDTTAHTGGFERKHEKNSHASATPACDGRHVYSAFVHARAVHVTATDLDGKIVWQREAGPYESQHGYGSSPVLHRETVIVVADSMKGSFLAALDKATGKIVWRIDRPVTGRNGSYQSPVVATLAGKPQLVIQGTRLTTGYDPDSGKVLWTCTGPSEVTGCTPAFDDKHVFATGGFPEKEILAVRADGSGDVTKTHVAWRSKKGVTYVPSPVHHAGRLYVVNDTGTATCFDAATGREVWSERLNGAFTSSPVLVGDRLYVTNETGRTYVLKTGDKFEQVAANDLGEGVLATPAVAGGRLYLRAAGHLYCISQ
jgi:outer membrane protein assembly factor BamB